LRIAAFLTYDFPVVLDIEGGPVSSQVRFTGDAQMVHDQVEKVLRSAQFTGSQRLRNLLSYLAKRSLERPGEPVKEFELAVDVLGRDPCFDSRLDSAVRVHTARLRAKLAEYYMADGAADPLILEIPKGSYILTWHVSSSQEISHRESSPESNGPATSPRIQRRAVVAWVAAAALAVGAAWGTLALRAPAVPLSIRTLWDPFLGSAPEPIVVFSNHRFVGNSSTGLRAYREGIDSPSDINDTYSGTGTVMAVHALSDLFSRFGRKLRLKRAELLTWDEAQTTNLILLGSPESNSRLRQLKLLQYFDFKSSRSEPLLGIGGVINLQPAPGEPPVFYGSGNPITSDYAVIALLPGLKPEQRIFMLAATNTYGLQAAAEFTSRPDLVGNLLSRLGVKDRRALPDFEALVEVKVNDGVPVQSRLLRIHIRKASPAHT
jgi:hypothetical protein